MREMSEMNYIREKQVGMEACFLKQFVQRPDKEKVLQKIPSLPLISCHRIKIIAIIGQTAYF